MPNHTQKELLQQLLDCERMFKNSGVVAKKKSELLKLEERRLGETPDIVTEFAHICAILPELIASVRRNQNLDRAAYHVGIVQGVFIGLAADAPYKEENERVLAAKRIAEMFFNESDLPERLHS